MIEIEKKIVRCSIVRPDDAPAAPEPALQQMNESMARPEVLPGATYKIKTPLSEHALYVTINDVTLNAGTPHEIRRPFEIFINSKAMDHFQWIVAMTRIMSATFRKGGDVTFLVEEMRSVFDPKGGYFKKGGKYMPSLVAEIGDVIESHMRSIGLMPDEDDSLAQAARAMVAAKTAREPEAADYPAHAVQCGQCQANAAIVMDGCLTCLSCGASKCG